ncbi:MAG: DNA polymerase ligase N-terminal domain-containing protein [Methanomicrobiales archaeon]
MPHLEEYRRKRDFSRTTEPSGEGSESGEEPGFVVQKHDASNLHYDIRLEINGVLVSWAVPKGPSLNPKVKRLAMPTEDHPLEYAGFEGVIPEGEYGAGTVMVWDRGTYENLRDDMSMEEALSDGKVEVRLWGEKLEGGWAFIRTGSGDNARWLLIKMDDEHADRSGDILDARPDSALTGRSLDEIQKEEG